MGPLKSKTTHSAARAGAKEEQLEPKLQQEEHTHNDAEFGLRTLREHDAHLNAHTESNQTLLTKSKSLFVRLIPHPPILTSHHSPLTFNSIVSLNQHDDNKAAKTQCHAVYNVKK